MNQIGILLLSLIFFHSANAAGRLQIVQSVPIETTLATTGVLQTQAAWLDLIHSAQKTIDLEEFYLSGKSGSRLDAVIESLKAAASRGVKIRILVDSKFYLNYSADANSLAKLPQVSLKTIDFSSTNGVMHAKYFVVDQQMGYLGSANFDWLALEHIHEIGLQFNDAGIAQSLEAVFNQDWSAGVAHQAKQSAAGFCASPASLDPVGVSPTLPALVSLINSAKSSLQVQNYEYNTAVYHSPERFKELDVAIRNSAARGVQVQLLVDQNALKAGSEDLKALSQLKNIQIKIIRIPQWSGGPLAYARLAHSKYCLIDGAKAWIGSENWSAGYFNNSRNVGLMFEDAEPVKQLGQIYNQLWLSQYASTF
ncbi:MAG: phospholipase [Bdellovibrionales bacterium]|nr:phospholipase [Oligoflexia bacterium]